MLSEKPPIAGENAGLSPGLLDELLYQIGTLASVYHKPPETFIAGRKYGADSVTKGMPRYGKCERSVMYILSVIYSHGDEEDVSAPPPQIQAAIKNNDIGNLLDLDWDEPAASPTAAESTQSITAMDDLLSLGANGGNDSTSPTPAAPKNNVDDILSLFNAPSSTMQQQSPLPQQQQQQANTLLTDDLFGSSSPVASSAPQQQQQQQSTASKDPFADLF